MIVQKSKCEGCQWLMETTIPFILLIVYKQTCKYLSMLERIKRGSKLLSLNNILRMKIRDTGCLHLLRSENATQREEFIPSLSYSALLPNYFRPL